MRLSVIVSFLVIGFKGYTQTSDCSGAINVCTNPNYSISPSGSGVVDFTTGNTTSNPQNSPVGIIPPGGMGCLLAGELNSTWMIINVQNPGTLEFSMGAGTGPGAQTGCYDWILWPYSGSTTCSQIQSNSLPPVRCCWNSPCSGGTGLASLTNLPSGGAQTNFGAPINALCGQQFVLCHSNYSSVSTLLPFNFFGTAVVTCSFSSCTGINKVQDQYSQLAVYPNPGSGEFSIVLNDALDDGFIEIYDSSGKLIQKQLVNDKTIEINLKEQAEGLYYLILTAENKQLFKTKLIKE